MLCVTVQGVVLLVYNELKTNPILAPVWSGNWSPDNYAFPSRLTQNVANTILPSLYTIIFHVYTHIYQPTIYYYRNIKLIIQILGINFK